MHRRIRLGVIVLLLIAFAIPARAQQAPRDVPERDERCLSQAAVVPVVVRRIDGSQRRGTLICLTQNEVTLVSPGANWVEPLAGVRQIVTPADPVWDGALKGVALGVALALVCAGECPPSYMLRATLSYAAAGSLLDAADPHRQVLYGSRRNQVSFNRRIRF